MLKLTDYGSLSEHYNFMRNNKPRIGITLRLEYETRRFYLGRDYSEAVQAFGGIPFHISLIPDQDYISEALRTLDGILLPGSNTDVDPFFYGEEPHPKLGRVIAEKDQTDLLVLAEAEKLNLPVLAICFGMQILNVFRGGTLYQDIESQIKIPLKHEQGSPVGRNSHSLRIEEDSRIMRLITKGNVLLPARVNSSHHQAVKTVGENLKPTAWAKDEVIECIEDTREGRYNLGVQWHPEVSWKTDLISKNIFQEFLSVSSGYLNGKHK